MPQLHAADKPTAREAKTENTTATRQQAQPTSSSPARWLQSQKGQQALHHETRTNKPSPSNNWSNTKQQTNQNRPPSPLNKQKSKPPCGGMHKCTIWAKPLSFLNYMTRTQENNATPISTRTQF